MTITVKNIVDKTREVVENKNKNIWILLGRDIYFLPAQKQMESWLFKDFEYYHMCTLSIKKKPLKDDTVLKLPKLCYIEPGNCTECAMFDAVQLP